MIAKAEFNATTGFIYLLGFDRKIVWSRVQSSARPIATNNQKVACSLFHLNRIPKLVNESWKLF